MSQAWLWNCCMFKDVQGKLRFSASWYSVCSVISCVHSRYLSNNRHTICFWQWRMQTLKEVICAFLVFLILHKPHKTGPLREGDVCAVCFLWNCNLRCPSRIAKLNYVRLLLLLLLLLSSSLSSSSPLLSPLCRLFTILYLKQTMSRVYSVAAILYLQFVLNVLLFRPWNVFCTFTLALSAVCVQCPLWLFL
jgi:hypothetical protein